MTFEIIMAFIGGASAMFAFLCWFLTDNDKRTATFFDSTKIKSDLSKTDSKQIAKREQVDAWTIPGAHE